MYATISANSPSLLPSPIYTPPSLPLPFIPLSIYASRVGKHLARVSLGCLVEACASSSGRFAVHMKVAYVWVGRLMREGGKLRGRKKPHKIIFT